MVEATWTIKDCDAHLVAKLAAALEIGQVTAAVLVRRARSASSMLSACSLELVPL